MNFGFQMRILAKTLNSNYLKFFLIVIIILYPIIFIWQCGDLTDTGFFALNYQFFFQNLKLGQTSSLSFFTDFIGGLYFKLFPSLGIIGLKLLFLLFFYLSIFFTFLILHKLTKKKHLLLIGVLVAVSFSLRCSEMIFSRDIASWLFLLISSYFMIIGFEKIHSIFMLISGFFFFIACLSRFPNITFFFLLLLVFSYLFIIKKNKTGIADYKFLFYYFVFVIGFFLAFTFFWFVLIYFELTNVFLSDLSTIFFGSESSYSSRILLKNYLNDFFSFFPQLIVITTFIISSSFIFKYSKQFKKPIIFIAYVIILLFIYILKDKFFFSYHSTIKYLVPAFCFFPLFFCLWDKDKFSVYVLVLLAISITQVAGSNTGFFLKFGYCGFILIPLSLIIISEKKIFLNNNFLLNTNLIISLGAAYIFLFSLVTKIGFIYGVDSGLSCRLRAIYPIENKLMKGIYTTKTNALHIKNLVNSIENNNKRKKSIFIFGHQPIFYYLTKNQPAVKKFWLVNDFVSMDELFFSISKSIQKSGEFPLIVDTKQKIMGDDGESELKKFLLINQYKKVEDNFDYSIWIVSSN